MPSIITHYRFAKYNLDRISYKRLGNVSSQGPDVFFFYGYGKCRRNAKEIRKFGVHLHGIDISDAFIYMIKYADEHKEHTDLLNHFIKGFVGHYLLDRNTHPYIYYRTGIDGKQWSGGDYFLSHAAFETSIDTYYALRCNLDHNCVKLLRCTKSEIKICSEMMYHLAVDVFKSKVFKPNTYYLAWKDMKFTEHILNSRFGIKKFFYRHFFKNTPINVLSHPATVTYSNVDIDFLNFEHSVWHDPVTNKVRNESFYELYARAEGELANFTWILEHKDIMPSWEADVKKMVNNIDHRGVPINSTIKYYENAWKKSKRS
ncbi:MAG: zinc dependent phospholipase C family protein [Bacilli bacterium]